MSKELRRKMIRDHLLSEDRERIQRDLDRLKVSNWKTPFLCALMILGMLSCIGLAVYYAFK